MSPDGARLSADKTAASRARGSSAARLVAAALAFGAICLAGLSQLGEISSLLEPLSNLRLQAGFAALIAASLAVLVRARIAAAALLASGAVLFMTGWLAHERTDAFKAPEATGPAFRLMTVNIDFTGRNETALVAQIRAASPDVLVLVEDFPEARARIADAVGGLPYRAETGIDVRAVLIASRFPLTEPRVHSTHYVAHILSARMAVETAEGPRDVRLIAAHATAPLSRWGIRERFKCLARIGELAGEETLPVIVAGDLNLDPQSPKFVHLLRSGRLRDTAPTPLAAATWMSRVPMIGLRIDHVLVGEGVTSRARQVLPDFGSDHRGVVVDLALEGEG